MEKEKTPPQNLKTEPNMLEPKRIYAFTLNPDNIHQFYDSDKNGKSRLFACHRFWRKKISSYQWEYELFPEISTPMNSKSTPRIHYHGLICFRNDRAILEWYDEIHYTLSNISYFDIDTWDGRELYCLYCRKNAGLMKRLCKLANIDYEVISLRISKLKQSYIDSLSGDQKENILEDTDHGSNDSNDDRVYHHRLNRDARSLAHSPRSQSKESVNSSRAIATPPRSGRTRGLKGARNAPYVA